MDKPILTHVEHLSIRTIECRAETLHLIESARDAMMVSRALIAEQQRLREQRDKRP